MNERTLTDVFRALNKLISNNPRSNSQLFAGWFCNNILCINQYLGTSFLNQEVDARPLLVDWLNGKVNNNFEPLLLEHSKRKQKNSGSKLKRIQSSINYDERNKRDKEGGNDIQIFK